MIWNDEFKCEICGATNLVTAFGDEKSPVLIIGEKPEDAVEMNKGIPFTGRKGTVLRQQFQHLGWDLNHFRRIYLQDHESKNPECFIASKTKCIQEAAGKKAILLIGADVVKEFTDNNVSNTCGMPVKSDFFSAEIIMPLYDIGIVYHSVLGEIQLGLQKFVKEIEKFYE